VQCASLGSCRARPFADGPFTARLLLTELEPRRRSCAHSAESTWSRFRVRESTCHQTRPRSGRAGCARHIHSYQHPHTRKSVLMLPHHTQLQAALSAAQQFANTLSTAATAVDSLAPYLPIDNYLRRRALVALGTRAAWGVAPVLGIGLAVWGVRAWRAHEKSNLDSPSTAEGTPPVTSQTHAA
jgi:hypothetical protein